MAIRLDLQVGLERTQKIAVVDLCRPSYVHPEQLRAAAIQKQDDYSPLAEVLIITQGEDGLFMFSRGWLASEAFSTHPTYTPSWSLRLPGYPRQA